MRTSLLALSLLFALGEAAQPLQRMSTMCQMGNEAALGDIVERRLIGCGAGFGENVLWHLDRSDSMDGTMDGMVLRRTTGRGAVIYVMDTGVMRDHVEFQRATGSNVIAGITFGGSALCPGAEIAPCFDPRFPLQVLLHGHGTGVASVAAGKHGVAPDASIVSVIYEDEPTLLLALREVIHHAFDPLTPPFHTGIINFSRVLRANQRTAESDELLARMISGVDRDGNPDPKGKRFFFTVAAGNYAPDRTTYCAEDEEKSVVTYPAILGSSLEGLVSVGGLDRNNHFWSGSCGGENVEILAPAPEVLVASIVGTDTYRFKPDLYTSGTSWSAPFVAGMAARLLEARPDLTPAQLESILKASPSRVDGLPVAVMIESDEPSGTQVRRRAVRH